MPLDPTGLVSHLPRQHREVSWKQPCWAASTGNLTLSAPGATIDGVTMAVGFRFLAKDQSSSVENGIYRWTGAATAAVRDFDMDQDTNSAVPAQEVAGAMVAVIAGTVNAGRIYRCTNTATVQLGVDAIAFTELASGSSLVVPVDHGAMGATETLDMAAGDWHRGTLSADCTITVQGFVVDQAAIMVFEVTQDGTGGWDIIWDGDVDFGGGDDQPDLTADTTTVFVLMSSSGDSAIFGSKFGGAASGTTSPLTTKGDVWGYSTVDARVPVGTDGQALVADSTEALGVRYGTVVGPILISDTPSTPLVFADLIQNEAEDDLVYAEV